eukprot:GHVS01042561.1.p1 GENE.GHVS01042561.1~~GHVS01042561.1.p1  ORF type:complete len:562 (+),score=163.73 GHVS01042561.1:301-1986(+)
MNRDKAASASCGGGGVGRGGSRLVPPFRTSSFLSSSSSYRRQPFIDDSGALFSSEGFSSSLLFPPPSTPRLSSPLNLQHRHPPPIPTPNALLPFLNLYHLCRPCQNPSSPPPPPDLLTGESLTPPSSHRPAPPPLLPDTISQWLSSVSSKILPILSEAFLSDASTTASSSDHSPVVFASPSALCLCGFRPPPPSSSSSSSYSRQQRYLSSSSLSPPPPLPVPSSPPPLLSPPDNFISFMCHDALQAVGGFYDEEEEEVENGKKSKKGRNELFLEPLESENQGRMAITPEEEQSAMYLANVERQKIKTRGGSQDYKQKPHHLKPTSKVDSHDSPRGWLVDESALAEICGDFSFVPHCAHDTTIPSHCSTPPTSLRSTSSVMSPRAATDMSALLVAVTSNVAVLGNTLLYTAGRFHNRYYLTDSGGAQFTNKNNDGGSVQFTVRVLSDMDECGFMIGFSSPIENLALSSIETRQGFYFYTKQQTLFAQDGTAGVSAVKRPRPLKAGSIIGIRLDTSTRQMRLLLGDEEFGPCQFISGSKLPVCESGYLPTLLFAEESLHVQIL